MKIPWTSMLLVLCLLLMSSFVADAAAQGVCTPQTAPVGVVFGRSLVSWQQSDYTAVNTDKTPVVTDFFGSVSLSGKEVTNFTIPKASVTLLTGSGVPANCYQTLLPAMTGLLSSNTYVLTITARGLAGNTLGSTSASFFLLGAPQSPANLSVQTPAVP